MQHAAPPAVRWLALAALLTFSHSGCDADSDAKEADACEVGTERCACYPNDTCNTPFTCLSSTCVWAGGEHGDAGPSDDEPRPGDAAQDDEAAGDTRDGGQASGSDEGATEVNASTRDDAASEDDANADDPSKDDGPSATDGDVPDAATSGDEPKDDTTKDDVPADDASETDNSDTNSSDTDDSPVDPAAGDAASPSVPPDDVIDEAGYTDAQLITSCSGPRGEVYDGAWFAISGEQSSIVPTDSSGSFPMSSGGVTGTAAHVTGNVAATDFASLGLVMYFGSAIFDASAYDGISFQAKAAAPLVVAVALAQENNDPSYGLCVEDVSCYNYPQVMLEIGTEWTRYVVPFAALTTDPSLPKLPTTPDRIKHWQFSFQTGDFDLWVDDVYFVQAQ